MCKNKNQSPFVKKDTKPATKLKTVAVTDEPEKHEDPHVTVKIGTDNVTNEIKEIDIKLESDTEIKVFNAV